jgi:hypothetical protein
VVELLAVRPSGPGSLLSVQQLASRLGVWYSSKLGHSWGPGPLAQCPCHQQVAS